MDFLHLITERPALLVKYIVFVIIILTAAIPRIIGRLKNRAPKSARRKLFNKYKTYSVTIYLGTDNMLRFVPQVENKSGIFVHIQDGVEIPFVNNPYEIGRAYCKAKDSSLSHYGEDLDMRNVPPEYKAFKSFKSQKSFNKSHCCIASFATENLLFTYCAWHDEYRGFCILKDDTECKITIDTNSDCQAIGNTILEILRMAKSAYPDTPALCSERNAQIIDNSACEIKD